MADGGPQVVAYVLGTDQDPQGYSSAAGPAGRGRLHRHRDRGARLLVAAAIATGDASLVGADAVSSAAARRPPRVALVTYSTKPRGGVVHTLSLADAMVEPGMPVRVVALGDPDEDFFRPVRAPYTLIPAPPPADTLEERVFASIDDLEAGLSKIADEVDILHTQDCISARAAARVRDAGAPGAGGADRPSRRRLHHAGPHRLPAQGDRGAGPAGRGERGLAPPAEGRLRRGRRGHPQRRRRGPVRSDRTRTPRGRSGRGAGVADRFVFLSVGGIEPRKGSVFLFQAMAPCRGSSTRDRRWSWSAGTRSRTTREYRDDVARDCCPTWASNWGATSILAGTVSDAELHEWYRSADALAFPSVKEGWGLAVLEAMAADLPVVSSDIAVLREYLTDRETAVLTAPAIRTRWRPACGR